MKAAPRQASCKPEKLMVMSVLYCRLQERTNLVKSDAWDLLAHVGIVEHLCEKSLTTMA